MDFPGGSVVKNPPAIQEMQEIWVQSQSLEDSLEKDMYSTPVFLHAKSQGQWTTVHGIKKSQTWLRNIDIDVHKDTDMCMYAH